jgi:ATP-dependent Lon protease
MAIKRTIAAMLKILHPAEDPPVKDLDEYMAYAIEGRRRVKEQMNKRKHDDEYARVNLSYINSDGEEIIVWCPESKEAMATQQPERKRLPGSLEMVSAPKPSKKEIEVSKEDIEEEVIDLTPLENDEPKEDHFTIFYGETGHSYKSIFAKYLKGCQSVIIEDPYIRMPHQIQNLVRFSEILTQFETIKELSLVTGFDNDAQKAEAEEKFEMLQESLSRHGIVLKWSFSPVIHDRAVKLDNGWVIKIGRGLDFYQKPDNWFSIGSSDLELRPCLETTIDVFKNGKL